MPRQLIGPLRNLQELLGLSRRVQSEDDLQALLDTTARAISDTLGFGSVVINVYRPAWDDYVAAAVESTHPGARELLLGSTSRLDDLAPLLAEENLVEGAYMTRTFTSPEGITAYTPDVPQPVDWETWGPDDWLLVPMRDVDGRMIALLSVDDPPGGVRPGADSLRLLVSFTSCVTLALESAQRSHAAARHQMSLEALLDISGRIARSSFEDLLETVCAGVRDALGFEKVAVQLIDDYGNLRWRAGVGFDLAGMPEGRTLDDLAPLMDPRFEIEGCFFVPSDEALARIPAERVDYVSERNGTGPRAWARHWLFVPLITADGIERGLLWADDPEDRLIPGGDVLKALRTFANSVTIALEAAAHVEHLAHAAEHDPLTGLGNRALLASRADVTALVVVDLDGFKTINDTYGHVTGDGVLVAVAERLRRLVRPGDEALRLGGDEFALLLHDCSLPAAEHVAERILGALSHPVTVEGRCIDIAASVGVAAGREVDDLLRRADRAMYRVKRGGKGAWASDVPAAVSTQAVPGRDRRSRPGHMPSAAGPAPA